MEIFRLGNQCQNMNGTDSRRIFLSRLWPGMSRHADRLISFDTVMDTAFAAGRLHNPSVISKCSAQV